MVDWSKQHCGVHQATYDDLVKYMPDLRPILDSFPDRHEDFIWDVKVHMLMPNQYPCIPNWHYDNVPRVNNKQDFDLVRADLPMYLWISGKPLPEFEDFPFYPKLWIRFDQTMRHRGTVSKSFTWRGFIRATHKDIAPAIKRGENCLRRHSQVYLDASNFSW